MDYSADFALSDEERRKLMLSNALLGLGAGLMQSGRGFSGVLGGAGTGLLAGVGLGQRAVADAREGKLDQAKMAEYMRKQQEAQAAAAARAKLGQEIGGLFESPTSAMPDRAPTTANAAKAPQKFEIYLAASEKSAIAGDLAGAKHWAELAEKNRPKFAQAPHVGIGTDNKPYTYVLDDQGNERRLDAGVPPKFRQVDTGGGVQIVNDYAIPAEGATFQKTLGPADVQRQQQWEAEQRLRVAADARAAQSATKANEPAWTNDLERGIQIDPRTGQSRPITSGGAPIGAKGATKQAEQSKTALTIINEAEKLVEKSTGSYLGAAVDQGARVFGGSTEGADASAQLQALEGALMLNQPRMEGPQSDKDTALYKQMAAKIGDPTVPNGQKKAALAVVKRLHQKYAAGVSASGATGGWSIQEVK